MRIRDAAARAGMPAATIRYYEQIGLLGKVRRNASGYRVFDEPDVRLLVFLRKAREIGFTLDECRELLALVTSPDRHSETNAARTRDLALRRRAQIDAEIAELRRRRELVQLHIDTLGEPAETCPVSDRL